MAWPTAALAQKKDKDPKKDPKDVSNAVSHLNNKSGLKLELWAAEPLLLNPVAIRFDHTGKAYVAETHRWKSSVYDIRGIMGWLEDDMAARTVEDRVAMHRKHMGPKADKLSGESEIIRLLEDRDGKGVATHSTVYAKCFDTLADGIMAGVLPVNGDVYVTCIPNLWKFRDTNGDGVADDKNVLHYGYGVHQAYLGHDLHGLIIGPDGKLYFSIGDRGTNITKSVDGRKLELCDTGAVFRCNLDGSGLEVFCTGLRNPQGLAFDEYGNLFTTDNNCDNGDKARFTYIIEGGDYGWQIGYQHSPKAGPWMTEKPWLPEADCPYRVPPIANISHGPSGFAFNPGVTALPAEYDRHFFLANCPGNVLAWTVKPKGAGFEAEKVRELVGSWWPSDLTFGVDGKLYVTDWVGEWDKNQKGRVISMHDAKTAADKAAALAETKQLIADSFTPKPIGDLVRLMGHGDMRVRQAAQLQAAKLGEPAVGPLSDVVADKAAPKLLRVHAIWALGQIGEKDAKALAAVPALLADGDEEIRTQAARVLGDRRHAPAAPKLLPLLKDASARVRMHVAIALGRIGAKEAVAPLLAAVKENADKDAFLRHGLVYALTLLGDKAAVLTAAKDADRSVRMASLLVMRRLQMPEIAAFLNDADPKLAFEAVRAINDAPVTGATAALAALADRPGVPAEWMQRVVNANFRLGTAEAAAALVRVAGRSDLPEAVRIEALKSLGKWEKPPARDIVIGVWRPVDAKARVADAARNALRVAAAKLLSTAPAAVKGEAAKTSAALGLKEAVGELVNLIKDDKVEGALRAEALATLASQKGAESQLAEAVKTALESPAEELKRQAVLLLPKAGFADSAARLEKLATGEGSAGVRAAACSALADLGASGDACLTALMDQLCAGKLPAAMHLDLLEAAAKRKTPELTSKVGQYDAARKKDDKLAAWRECLEGGDPATGKRIFYTNLEAGCLKCHAAEAAGGEVGPRLAGIGAKQKPEYLLESIVLPNAAIAKGYEQVIIKTTDETTEVGRIESETAEAVVLLQADGKRKTIKKSEIDSRVPGKSAMPEDLMKHLSKRDLRDLVAYLASLKEEYKDPTKHGQ